MNTESKKKITEKMKFEPAEIEFIMFDAKADIICTSPIVGEEDLF